MSEYYEKCQSNVFSFDIIGKIMHTFCAYIPMFSAGELAPLPVVKATRLGG